MSSINSPKVRGNILVAFLVIVFINACLARADDSGDSFTNNLLTDLAPILALFGEQVTKQFLSQTITWYDCVIFAIFPLGIITTVVSAIRVAAPNSWKALVGRARESRAMAELELLSSTSLEVCEMWDGQAIVRVMGSPQILELVYVKERKDKKECGLYTLRDESERETKHAALKLKASNAVRPSDVETQRHSQPLEGFDGTDGAPAPNISLNLAPPPYSRKQSLLWFVAFAASLQLGVLVFCAMAIYHPPWIPRFRKDGSPVVGSAYPVAAAGIITTTVGMFLCAWIIEQSTKEEAWQAKAEESTSTAGAAPAEPQVHILWLQQRKIVNDQSFDSYAIFAPGLRDCILTSRRDENMGSHGRTPQQSGDSMVELSGPHQKLAIIGAVTTIVGFTLSFSGLRLMHWSATMAQFVGTAIMTCVRIWLRRDLAGRPDAQWVLDGYEMDWLALELAARGESLWSIPRDNFHSGVGVLCSAPTWTVTGGDWDKNNDNKKEGEEGVEKESAEEEAKATEPGHDLASRAHSIRERLGQLSKWTGRASEAAISVATAIEAVMNTLYLQKLPQGFRFPINAQVVVPGTSESITQKVFFSLKWDDDTNRWTVSTSEIEAALSLRLFTEAQNSWIRSRGNRDTEKDWLRHGRAGTRKSLRFLGPDDFPTHRDLIWWGGSAASSVIVLDTNETAATEDVNDTTSDRNTGTTGVLKSPLIKIPKDYALGAQLESDPAPGSTENSFYNLRYRLAGDLSNLQQDPRGKAYQLASTSNGPIELVYAQEFFSSFIWAVARHLKGPIQGLTTARAVSAIGAGDISWKSFRLKNSLLQKMAQEVQIAGLATTEEAYMLLIPPLSVNDKLPEPLQIIDLVRHETRNPEASGQWSKVEELYFSLWEVCKPFGPEHPLFHKGAAILMEFLRSVMTDLCLSKQQLRQGSAVEILEILERKIVAELKSLDRSIVTDLLEVYELQKRPSLQDVLLDMRRTFEPQPTDPRRPVRWFVESSRKIRDIVDRVVDGFSYDKRLETGTKDIFDCSILHYYSAGTSVYHDGPHAESFLSNFPDKDPIDITDFTPLHWAADNQNEHAVSQLLGWRADMEVRGRDGSGPLHCAARSGNADIIRRLFNAGAKEAMQDRLRQTPLHWVAYHGHVEILNQLLRRDASINAEDDYGRTPLHLAVIAGRNEAVERLLESADIKLGDRDGNCAVHLAGIRGGDSTTMKSLLGCGVDSEAKNSAGATALHLAAGYGHEVIARVLIDNGANKEAQDGDGRIALHRAAEEGREAVVRFLLDIGVDKEAKDGNRRTALHWAASNGHETIVRLLLKIGIDKEAKDGNGRTALHWAAANGHETVVRFLFKNGVEKEAKDGGGRTALQWASANGHETTGSLLLEEGVHKNATDTAGRTALYWAAVNGHDAFARLLLENGVDKDVRDGGDQTALHVAVRNGHEAVARVLIGHGANKDAKDKTGRTALRWAAAKGDDGIARLLLGSGVDKDARDSSRRTALHWAAANGHETIVRLLLEIGIDKEAKDDNGRTALHWAATNGHQGIVRLLLENGVEKDARDVSGCTSLHLAAVNGHRAVFSLLIERGADRDVKDNMGQTALEAMIGR